MESPRRTKSSAGSGCTAQRFERLLRVSAVDYEPNIDLVTELGGDEQAPRRRLLMIVNPYATTVSSRLKNLVISALRAATRSTRSTRSGATTRLSSVAKPAEEGTTRSSPSAVTGP